MKLVKKYIQLEFADPRLQAVDAIVDLRKAAERAGLNLYSRFDIELQWPMIVDSKVVVEVRVPEDMAESFSPGNRLRGISAYLLKNCNGRYDQYLVGQRLLTYTEVSEQALKPKSLTTANQLEAVANFATLCLRTDDAAKDRVSRIISILNEDEDDLN